MERRAMIALALSFVVFLAFIYFGQLFKSVWPRQVRRPSRPNPTRARPRRHRPPRLARPAPAAPAPPRAAARPVPEDVVVETPLFQAVFTELGGRLKSFQLKKYLESLPFTTHHQLQAGIRSTSRCSAFRTRAGPSPRN